MFEHVTTCNNFFKKRNFYICIYFLYIKDRNNIRSIIMSWPSSNFHHDSFEYINPPRPEYKPSSFHISHNTYINFKGPSDSAVKTAGWLNFAGGVFNGLANLGSAFLLSKGNSAGAQAMQMGASTIGNLLGGGGFNGYGTGFGGAGWGGTGGGYLIDQTYYRQTPIIPGSSSGTTGTDTSGKKTDGTDSGKKSDGTGNGKKTDGTGDGKKTDGTGNNKKTGGTGSGKKADGAGDGKKTDGTDNGKKPDATGSGKKPDNSGDGKITADYFNKAVDDKLDRNNDGKVDKKDIFSADVFNSTHNLGHTTSKVGDATGIRRGVAASKTGNVTNYKDDEKTTDGFYKYITVTDKDSSNEWAFEYVKTDGSGNPVYKFSPTYSDLSKDDNGSNKNWESTGKTPEYTVTIDAKTGEIKMASSGNEFSASKKGHLGRI